MNEPLKIGTMVDEAISFLEEFRTKLNQGAINVPEEFTGNQCDACASLRQACIKMSETISYMMAHRDIFCASVEWTDLVPARNMLEQILSAMNESGQILDESALLDMRKPGSDRNMPIEELDLTAWEYNILCRGGLRTVGDILKFGKHRLLCLRGMGKGRYDNIIEKLKGAGFDCASLM